MTFRISEGKIPMGKAESENDTPNSMALSSRTSGTIVCSPIAHYPLNDLGLCRIPALIEDN